MSDNWNWLRDEIAEFYRSGDFETDTADVVTSFEQLLADRDGLATWQTNMLDERERLLERMDETQVQLAAGLAREKQWFDVAEVATKREAAAIARAEAAEVRVLQIKAALDHERDDAEHVGWVDGWGKGYESARRYAARWKALADRLMKERDSAYRHDGEKASRNRYLSEECRKLTADRELIRALADELAESERTIADFGGVADLRKVELLKRARERVGAT